MLGFPSAHVRNSAFWEGATLNKEETTTSKQPLGLIDLTNDVLHLINMHCPDPLMRVISQIKLP